MRCVDGWVGMSDRRLQTKNPRGPLWCVLEPHDIVTTLRAVLRENKKGTAYSGQDGTREW